MNTDREKAIESFEKEIDTLKNNLDTFRKKVSTANLPLDEIARYTNTIKNMNDLIKSVIALFL